MLTNRYSPRPLMGLYCLLYLLASAGFAPAQDSPLPVPVGLEDAVEFWKQIFSRYSFGEVVFFDPLEPSKVYSVVRAPENDQGRARIAIEQQRIMAEYDLGEDDSRVRSQRGAKEHFAAGLQIAGRYLPSMQKIFRDAGLPGDLVYLPLVESSFNIRARSSAGAVGMWQFMLETGKKFMRIDKGVDERRDPMTSTRAAARLLAENYRILGSWPLAVTAYNHGPEGLFRGIAAVGSRDLVDLIRHYQSPTWGFASKNFYAELLAVSEIAADAENHFPSLRPHRAVVLSAVPVSKSASLRAVLSRAAISRSEFFQWNPALEPDTKVIPLSYRVNLPAEKVAGFQSAYARAGVVTVKSPVISKKAKQKSTASTQASKRKVLPAKAKGSHASDSPKRHKSKADSR